MQTVLTFYSKNISVYACMYMLIFNDQTFYDTFNNDIVSFEQLCTLFATLYVAFVYKQK